MCTFSDKSIQSHCSIDTRTRIQPAKHFVYLHIIIYGAIVITSSGKGEMVACAFRAEAERLAFIQPHIIESRMDASARNGTTPT